MWIRSTKATANELDIKSCPELVVTLFRNEIIRHHNESLIRLRIEEIHTKRNNQTTLPVHFFDDLAKLEEWNLFYNTLKTLSENLFRNQINLIWWDLERIKQATVWKNFESFIEDVYDRFYNRLSKHLRYLILWKLIRPENIQFIL